MATTDEPEETRDNFTPARKIRQRFLFRWSFGEGLLPFQIVLVPVLTVLSFLVLHLIGMGSAIYIPFLVWGWVWAVLQLTRRNLNYKQPERYLADTLRRPLLPKLGINGRRRRPPIPVRTSGSYYIRAHQYWR